MSQKLRVGKVLDSSFVLPSPRNIKGSLTSRKIQFPEETNQHFNISKIMQKYKQQNNKSEIHLLTDQKTKMKTNDYIKKIIFDNQELNKKIKQVIKINTFLEHEKNFFKQKYQDMKQSFIELKQLYKKMADQNGIQITERYELGRKTEMEVFNAIFSGFDLLPSSNSLKQNCDYSILNDIDQTSSIKILPPKLNIQQINNKRRQTIYTFRKALSLHTQQVETQTQFIPPQSISIDQQSMKCSPSSNEAELLSKIALLQATVSALQKNNIEISGKYQRIRSIISGQLKNH